MNFCRMTYWRLWVAFAGALTAPAIMAQGVIKGDPAKAQQTATQVCAACHGAGGNSVIPVNPNLAGQHPEYTYKQLMNFKAQGGKPAERANPIMAGMVANLAQEDMQNLAVYFAGQKPKPGMARDASLIKQGEAIYRGGVAAKGLPACAACHAPNGAGMPAQFPRVAGQHVDYVVSQLKAFRGGQRVNDPGQMMRGVAAKMSDQEMAAVAEYISGLR